MGITLRARDRREEKKIKKISQQQRKNGEALSVEKQTKGLLLLLSNTSKILHLYLLSTLALSYIPDELSKKTEETGEELTLSISGPCFLSLLACSFLHYFP